MQRVKIMNREELNELHFTQLAVVQDTYELILKNPKRYNASLNKKEQEEIENVIMLCSNLIEQKMQDDI